MVWMDLLPVTAEIEVYVVTAQLLWRHEVKNLRQTQQTIVYQRGEDFSSHEREQKSSSFARRNFFRTNANKNLRYSYEEIFFARTQKSSTLARKLVNTNAIRMRRIFFERKA